MTKIFLQILNMSISATWLVLAVLALRFLLKKAPRWIHVLLWGLVAFRLLCPFTLESAMSLIPSAQTIPPQIMTEQVPQIHTGVDALNSTINPILSQSLSPAPAASANPLQIWIPIFSIIWCAGIALMLLYTLFSYLRLRSQVKLAIRAKGNIYLSEFVPSPFVLGLFKPRIYLPYHMNEQDRRHVIAHERAHIRRRDHWWKPLGFLLLSIHWFNPLMWLAYILLCRDIELACDEKVIRQLGTDQRADYSQALLHCSITHRSIAACPIAFGEVGVKERVKNVLSYQKPAFWVIFIGLVLVLIVSVCFLTDPKTETNEPLLSILRQESHTIHGQSPSSFSAGIAREKLPEDCFTPEGHTFQEKDLPIVGTETSRIFIRNICLDENPQLARVTYEFSYNFPQSGEIILPFRVNLANGEPLSLTNTLTGEHILKADIPSIPGVGNEDPLTVTTRVQTALLKQNQDVIDLQVGELITLYYSAKNMPVSILGKTYQVTSIPYADPRYSSIWSYVGIPYCAVTQDCHFLSIDGDNWANRGEMEILELRKANFDDLFLDFDNAAQLRKENQQAWSVSFPDGEAQVMVYLLRQKTNDLYLVYGYSEGENQILRWVLKLAPCDETDWVISMSLEDVSRTGAFLKLRQVGSVPDGELVTGRYYALEKWENDRWTTVPSLLEERVFSTEALLISPDSHVWESLNWEKDYGSLTDGRYRIQKVVTLEKGLNDHEDRVYYAEFLIGGTEDTYISFLMEDVSPTGMIVYEQENIDTFDSVIVDNFWLEAWQDGGWSYLEPTEYLESVLKQKKHYIPTTHHAEFLELDWSSLYGELPAGKYRIAREYSFVDGSEANLRTVYGEFQLGSDWGIQLLADRIRENSLSLSLLFPEDLPKGEYYFTGFTLQAREFPNTWKDILSQSAPSPGQDLLQNPGFNLLWDEKMYALKQGEHRVGVQIRHVLPDGTEESNTLYEYFDPETYAWGMTLDVSEVSDTGISARLTNTMGLPTDSFTFSRGFRLEKRENNQWTELEPMEDLSDWPWDPIPKTSSQQYLKWKGTYGELPNGTYRLVQEVRRTFGPGDTENRPIYAVFAVDSHFDVNLGVATLKPDPQSLVTLFSALDADAYQASALYAAGGIGYNLFDYMTENLINILKSLGANEFSPSPGISPNITIDFYNSEPKFTLSSDGEYVEFDFGTRINESLGQTWCTKNENLNTYIQGFLSYAPENSTYEIYNVVPLDEIPQSYTLEEAAIDRVVTFVDGDISANQEVWDAFLADVNQGKEASVRTMEYFNLGDRDRYALDLYEQIKDSYPKKFFYDLHYDGKIFTLRHLEDGKEIVKTYQYLRHFTGTPPSSTATFDSYDQYLLTNNASATWEEIFFSAASSQAGAYIDHHTVYSDYTYVPKQPEIPTPVKIELQQDGDNITTITEEQQLHEICHLLRNAQRLWFEPKTYSLGLELVFTAEDGGITTVPLVMEEDLCKIGNVFYDYGPGETDNGGIDNRAKLFSLLGVNYVDPDVLIRVLDNINNDPQRELQRLKRALELKDFQEYLDK